LKSLFPDYGEAMADSKTIRNLEDRIGGSHWVKSVANRRVRRIRVHRKSQRIVVKVRLAVRGYLGGLHLAYVFNPDGSCEIRMSGRPSRPVVRFGTRFALPKRFREVEWYGRGPQEAYGDRKRGALVGLYRLPAEKLSHDYVRPQENGNRTDVRRVSIFENLGRHLQIEAVASVFDFSAHHAHPSDIAIADHPHEVSATEDLHINVDLGQRGVGGSVPAMLSLLPKYVMKGMRKYDFRYRIRYVS
jgi:hypothetical protein